MKEIRIIGGGLAGLVTGILLRRENIPVRLSEAGRYPRHRVCGEFISPRDPGFWTQLGMEEILRESLSAETVAWIWPDGYSAHFKLPHPARAVSRYSLDQRLAELFTSLGGELQTGHREESTAAEGKVLATGRKTSAAAWIGLKAHYAGLEVMADLEMYVGRGAYVGLCRVEAGLVNVCGLFKTPKLEGERQELLEQTLEAAELKQLARRLRAARADNDSRCAVSGLSFGALPPEASVRLGDRWGMIPPFTGNGMSMALESACVAAPHLADYARGKVGWESMRLRLDRELTDRFLPRLRRAQFLHGCLTGRGSIPLFSTLSRMGLLPWRTIFGALG